MDMYIRAVVGGILNDLTFNQKITDITFSELSKLAEEQLKQHSFPVQENIRTLTTKCVIAAKKQGWVSYRNSKTRAWHLKPQMNTEAGQS